jgi:hypothetical protein
MSKKKLPKPEETPPTTEDTLSVPQESTEASVVVQEETLEGVDLRTAPIDKIWELYPKLDHLTGQMRLQLEDRRRLRKVRYLLFRLRTQCEKNEPFENVGNLPPGFVQFWSQEKPKYQIDPRGKKIPVPPNKNLTVDALGGYAKFGQVWDVDHDLMVYLRHSSVWQEWAVTLNKVAPIIGE